MPKATSKKPDFSMKMIDLEAYKENRLELPPEGWEWMGITEQDFKIHQAKMLEREKAVPRVGAQAPDFEIERLAADGSRSGEMFRLSSMLGQTVALVFGSYT
jgi:hypothetical protein